MFHQSMDSRSCFKIKGLWDTLHILLILIIFFFSVTTVKAGQKRPIESKNKTKDISFSSLNIVNCIKNTHVRQKPNAKSPSLDLLLKGELVRTLEKEGKWSKVQYGVGKNGWIFSENISSSLLKKIHSADRLLYVKENVIDHKGVIQIYFNGTISEKIKAFKMKFPPRIVLDVPGLKVKKSKIYSLRASSLVSEIKVGLHSDKTRLVLIFNRKIDTFSYRINKFIVTLKIQTGRLATARISSTKREKTARNNQKKAKEVANQKPILVLKTGFRDGSKLSFIVLDVTSIPSYFVKTKKEKLALILKNTTIDKRYTRFLDTSAFPTPIKRIEFKNLVTQDGQRQAEVWVSMRAKVPYRIVKGNHTLTWSFYKPQQYQAESYNTHYKKTAKTSNGGAYAKTSSLSPVKTEAKKASSVPLLAKKTVEKRASMTNRYTGLPSKRYTGTRITLNFYKADIHDILRLIAQVSNLNIVTSDSVKGKITLYLKNVPWDQALDIILQTKGLGKQRVGNVIRIARLSELENEFKEKLAAKQNEEKLEKRVTAYIPINYTTAANLSVKVKSILSRRGTVTVDERTNTLIVKDVPKKVKDVKTLIKRLDTPTPEVLIESRVVEANSDFTREIGIKWGMRYNAGPQYGNPPSSNFPNSMNIRGGATGVMGGTSTTGGTAGTSTTGGVTTGASSTSGVLPMVNLPVTASYGAIGVTLEQVADIFTLDAELSAMEDNGEGRIISSPRIVTLDNKTAKIEQGLRIPYLKITEMGTVTTDFIEANLNMEVTPHVSNDKMISMQIQVSKDTPDWTHLVQGVPSIDKKTATTNVMVKDGGVTAIGGIFTIERTKSIHKVPFLGDIPILGWAFKNKRTVRNRKELLIFISPKLVHLK